MSNLLDKSSIVLTPTAYDNGKVLCVKPSDGSGDFDFSRNSAATRVNAQGLVEDVQILSSNLVQNGDFSEQGAEEVSNGSFSQQGSELVTNGDFSTDSNWNGVGSNGVDISNGSLNYSETPNGANITQASVVEIGKSYKVTFTISNYVKGGILVVLGAGGTTQEISANGTFTLYGVASINNTLYVQARGASGTTLSIDNVSIVKVGQDWTFGTGWSVGEDKAVCDGTQTSNSSLVQQGGINGATINFVVGKTYKVNFDVVVTSGVITMIEVASGLDFNSITASGNHTTYITAVSTNNRFTILANPSFIGSVTNISVKEVGQNWEFNSTAIITNDGMNIKTGGFIRQDVVEIGKKYKLTYDIVSYTIGSIRVYDGTNQGNIPTNLGSNTFNFTAGGSNFIIQSNSVNVNITITNISIIEITDDTNLPRISYEGFSYQDALGSEEIVNGNFATDLSGWTLSSSTPPIWDNKMMKMTSDGVTFSRADQSFVTKIGVEYKFEINKLINSNSIQVKIGNGIGNSNVLNQTLSSVDKYTFTITPTSTNTYIRIEDGSGTEGAYVSDISVKEYLGQEVVPDSGCGSWLFEPQSTNIIPYSEDFSDWINTGTTDALSATELSPNGVDYSTLLVGSSAAISTKRIRSSASISLLTTYSFSAYVKSDGRNYIQFINSGDAEGYANFDVVNGLVGTSGSKSTSKITSLSNGWFRCEITTDATAVNGRFMIYLVDTNTGVFGSASTGTDGVYIFGAQLEALSYSTSYIPTDGQASGVTRNQDVCTNGGSVSTINSTEGVLYFEGSALADDGTYRLISLEDNSDSSTFAYIGYKDTSNTIRVRVEIGGTLSADMEFVLTSAKDLNKIAFKWKTNDFALWVNGVEVSTDTSGASFTANTLDSVNFSRNGINNFFGNTKCLAVWKEALTDTELQELTTI